MTRGEEHTSDEGRTTESHKTEEGRSAQERASRAADGQGGEGTVSEGGSGALNPDTSLGGADSVPDTPDVNTRVSDTGDANEPGQAG